MELQPRLFASAVGAEAGLQPIRLDAQTLGYFVKLECPAFQVTC
jgi:hypothetical protein